MVIQGSPGISGSGQFLHLPATESLSLLYEPIYICLMVCFGLISADTNAGLKNVADLTSDTIINYFAFFPKVKS